MLLLDANPASREAITEQLTALGYDVIPVEDEISAGLLAESCSADFAVVLRPAGRDDTMVIEPAGRPDASFQVMIGYIRFDQVPEAREHAMSMDEITQHMREIFGAIAAQFLGMDRERARRLDRGIEVLRAKIWN